MSHRNIYFELTDAFNRDRRIAVLGSGQAVVHYRQAIMSKDGDWILREDSEACAFVLDQLTARGARYRPGAPLDVRWLAGGWSSHFEFSDESGRRVRCDFFSRAPRVPTDHVLEILDERPQPSRPVVAIEDLIRMKQTQRAKDYPIIGALARKLPPEKEILYTTDPDRILELAEIYGPGLERPAVKRALAGRGRRAIVVALAEEIDDLQQRDRDRLSRYQTAALPFLESLRRLPKDELELPGGHERVIDLAEQLLPKTLREAR